MGKGGAGEYPTTKSDSELWGSSVSNGSGTKFTPTQWQKDTMNIAGQNLAPTLSEYLNPQYNSAEYLKTKQQFDNQAQKSYENNVLSNLSNRGLMRSSGLQASTNAFNQTLADNEANLMNQYKQSKLTDLSTLLGLSTDLYNYSQGENKLSSSLANAVANYNLSNQALMNNSQANTMGAISSGVGKALELGAMFSDKCLKENLVKLATVNGFNIYKFEFKQDTGLNLPKGKQIGVIAQEVPEEYREKQENGYYTVNYSKLPPLVQQTIKELSYDLEKE